MKEPLIILLTVFISAACSSGLNVPVEFPTPPPAAQVTPAPPLSLKRDADLEKQFAAIARKAVGEVGAAAVLLDTGEAALLNADEHFPMQSVYKLPISMAVLEQVDRGRLALDEKIGVTADDMVRKGMRSPLRDKDPNGGEFTIRELIRLSMVESDGTASDVLMRLLEDRSEFQAFLTRIGIFELKVVNTEKEIGRDWETQYRNYASPAAAVELLRWLSITAKRNGSGVADDEDDPWVLLLRFMAESTPGANRLKGMLPNGTLVAHKTGTSGTQNGVTSATNDVGIVTLPDGREFAIAIFVSDSKADEKTREAVIAEIARAAWERWSK